MCQRADRLEAERATGLSQKAAGPNDGVYGTLLEFMGVVVSGVLLRRFLYRCEPSGATDPRGEQFPLHQ